MATTLSRSTATILAVPLLLAARCGEPATPPPPRVQVTLAPPVLQHIGTDAAAAPATATASADAGNVSCVDAALKAAHRNRFGDPEDTVYAGGSPLMDERTGKTLTRDEYLKAKHPELKLECP